MEVDVEHHETDQHKQAERVDDQQLDTKLRYIVNICVHYAQYLQEALDMVVKFQQK